MKQTKHFLITNKETVNIVMPKPILKFFVRVEYTKITLHTKFEVPIQSASGPKHCQKPENFAAII